ncbi:hypothetical protein DHEL01_v206097 [Diaporthe helianthi]|uniref:Uncharacterized protein n=1 Tax=Diaporthe helianthi TaxID=158607 RepID=A0A2P5HZ35_DIAHE|nr:hypothetical protein DHEL01_v206097 [Diaporthe helianthi]
MSGRRHAPPDHHVQQQQQYNRDQVRERGLACPFAKSDPDTYMSIAACRTTEGFKELRELNEHIWRKHTPFFRCGFCTGRWSISLARSKVTQKKEEHWETCEGKRRGTPYFVERFDEDGTELLDGEQQERFEEIKTMRGYDRKLKALYEACEKPVPDDYYAPAASTIMQRTQVAHRTITRATTTARRGQQQDSHGGEFLAGFVQPRPEGHHRQPRRRTTARNVSQADAKAGRGARGYEVSGANRQPDDDSGYVAVDPSLYSSAGLSSSHRRHADSQALLGLALPGPGEGDVEEPVSWSFSSLDADLLDY